METVVCIVDGLPEFHLTGFVEVLNSVTVGCGNENRETTVKSKANELEAGESLEDRILKCVYTLRSK